MPINRNHEFEDLNGVKCSIVERNATAVRVGFLQPLLLHNGYEVIVVESPPAKGTPAKPAIVPTEAEVAAPAASNISPAAAKPTYTIGVTDVMFNPVNAIFGRLLHTPTGKVVTLAYWEQKEQIADDSVPYFEKGFLGP